MIKYIVILFLLLVIAAGCQREGVIDEDKFVQVYADLLIAGDTVSIKEAKNEVFGRYNINQNEYNNTVEYYSSNPAEWETFFNKVIAHIEQKRKDSFSSP
jgi:hypothetical protein